MSMRQKLKVYSRAAVYFPSDGTYAQLETKNMLCGQNLITIGNQVKCDWGGVIVEAKILYLHGK